MPGVPFITTRRLSPVRLLCAWMIAGLMLGGLSGCQVTSRDEPAPIARTITTGAGHVSLVEAQDAKGIHLDTLTRREGVDSPRRFGVFIGIDRYPNLEGHDLDGCVFDAWKMHALFTQRFGIQRTAMLTNGHATRKGIRDAFAALLDAIKSQRESDREQGEPNAVATVVISFAGHGRQVLDDADDEERDGLDETWAPSDTGVDAKHDIRDDELRAFYRQLVALNCQVLLFSDSCHSGSVHRGQYKMRRIHQPKAPHGPSDDLFAVFTGKQGQTRSSQGDDDAKPLPGFVVYSACHESSQAFECSDAEGRRSGRFTHSLYQVLSRSRGVLTYGSLYREVVLAFEQNWPGDPSQRPYFHADPSKQDALFLGGGLPPAHARVVKVDPASSTVTFSQGTVDGVTVGSRLSVFASLDDLARGRKPMARPAVVRATPFACEVSLDPGPSHVGLVARSEQARFRDFAVASDGARALPPAVRRQLEAMHEQGQLRWMPSSETASSSGHVVLRIANDATPTAYLYRPTRLPVDRDRDDASLAIAVVRADDEKQLASAVAEQLLYLARVQRIMSLAHDAGEQGDGKPLATLRAVKRTADGQLKAMDRPIVGGVPRLRDGDLFTVEVTNHTKQAMHVALLYLDSRGDLHAIYPTIEAETDRIDPGTRLVIGHDNPFKAGAEDAAAVRRDGFERLRMKVLLSAEPIALRPMTARPRPDKRTQRDADPAGPPSLNDLLSDLAQGGRLTRSTEKPISMPWAVATLIADVEPTNKK